MNTLNRNPALITRWFDFSWSLNDRDEDTDVFHIEFTTANVHDSEKFAEMLFSTEKRVHV